MSDTLVLRERFDHAARTFTVLGEPWFDPEHQDWKGRLLFLPLDRSFPHALSTGPVARSRQRGALLDELRALSDRQLRRAFRTLPLAALARG